MIVLDEQLLGRGLEVEIARWYRGAVSFITEIRPASVIKDDAMPALLHRQNQPTFVTINEIDFWRKVEISPHFVSSVSPYPMHAPGNYLDAYANFSNIRSLQPKDSAWVT